MKPDKIDINKFLTCVYFYVFNLIQICFCTLISRCENRDSEIAGTFLRVPSSGVVVSSYSSLCSWQHLLDAPVSEHITTLFPVQLTCCG